jgi:hypothetical protein
MPLSPREYSAPHRGFWAPRGGGAMTRPGKPGEYSFPKTIRFRVLTYCDRPPISSRSVTVTPYHGQEGIYPVRARGHLTLAPSFVAPTCDEETSAQSLVALITDLAGLARWEGSM